MKTIQYIMNITAQAFRWFGQDGMMHIIVSCLLTSVIGLMIPMWIAAPAVLALGVAKEWLWDRKLGKGTPEAKDLVADAAGVIMGCL